MATTTTPTPAAALASRIKSLRDSENTVIRAEKEINALLLQSLDTVVRESHTDLHKCLKKLRRLRCQILNAQVELLADSEHEVEA